MFKLKKNSEKSLFLSAMVGGRLVLGAGFLVGTVVREVATARPQVRNTLLFFVMHSFFCCYFIVVVVFR